MSERSFLSRRLASDFASVGSNMILKQTLLSISYFYKFRNDDYTRIKCSHTFLESNKQKVAKNLIYLIKITDSQ